VAHTWRGRTRLARQAREGLLRLGPDRKGAESSRSRRRSAADQWTQTEPAPMFQIVDTLLNVFGQSEKVFVARS